MLSILGMFTDVDIRGLPPVVDPDLLRDGDDSGFLLSGTQFLKNVLLPALPNSYQGSNASEFKMSADMIVNNGDISLEQIKVGLIWYPPKINALRISIANNTILTEVAGRCDITGLTDAYVSFSVRSQNQVQFLAGPPPALSFLADPNKVVDTGVSIPAWEQGLGALTSGLLNAITGAVSLSIERSLVSEASGNGAGTRIYDALLGAALVRWQGSAAVPLTDGGLLDNLYMRG